MHLEIVGGNVNIEVVSFFAICV